MCVLFIRVVLFQNIRKQLGDSATSAAIIAALPPVLKPGPPLSPRATRALLTLGPYLGRKPTLLIKVCVRVCVRVCEAVQRGYKHLYYSTA